MRLIGKWLNAGVLEEGRLYRSEVGGGIEFDRARFVSANARDAKRAVALVHFNFGMLVAITVSNLK